MENVIRVSKHLLPVERIALFEPFVPSSGEPLNTKKEFKTRIVLRDRISVLSEEAPEELSKAHGFRWIEADRVGANPVIPFRVELFAPTESFNPSKQFLSRMAWNDEEGNSQSKLMLTAPEALLALVVRGQSADADGGIAAPAPTRRRSQRSRRPRQTRDPA
ncbi:hypothetical protein BSN85_16410 [Bradyrhizobium brasilense]|uniref:hypothetical protein n=1 Tax=Bradyrhizobium brasilense TaxID=1419277 RepID=UPI000976CF5B|nr:hypothetical protein [Bradyrhizobium brasilense]OMI09509.1 hypothetical protein BSN85_16410 [Bradyrhizobium brasilense]